MRQEVVPELARGHEQGIGQLFQFCLSDLGPLEGLRDVVYGVLAIILLDQNRTDCRQGGGEVQEELGFGLQAGQAWELGQVFPEILKYHLAGFGLAE